MNWFIRFTAVLAVIAVAFVTAWLSYTHAYHVVLTHGQGVALARLYPLTIDGLVYATSMAILDHARRGVQAPRLAKWLLALGILTTGAVNVWAGLHFGWTGALISAWPALALVGTYEMLMQIIRGQKIVADEQEAKAPLVPQMQGYWPLEPSEPVPAKPAFAGVNGSARPKGEAPAKPERAKHAKGHPTPEAAEREFYKEIQRGEVPSIAEIQRRLRVGTDKAKSYQAHFRQVGRIYREQVSA